MSQTRLADGCQLSFSLKWGVSNNEVHTVTDLPSLKQLASLREEEKFPARIARRLANGEAPLRVIREWRGLTVQELSNSSKLPELIIEEIETGKACPTTHEVEKLAKELHVSKEILIDD